MFWALLSCGCFAMRALALVHSTGAIRGQVEPSDTSCTLAVAVIGAVVPCRRCTVGTCALIRHTQILLAFLPHDHHPCQPPPVVLRCPPSECQPHRIGSYWHLQLVFLLLTHTSCILLQGCVCGAAWRSSLDLEVLTDVWCIALLYLHRLHIICLVEGDHKPSISSWDMDASGAAPLVGALDHSCATVPTIPRVVVVAGGAAGTIGVSGHIHLAVGAACHSDHAFAISYITGRAGSCPMDEAIVPCRRCTVGTCALIRHTWPICALLPHDHHPCQPPPVVLRCPPSECQPHRIGSYWHLQLVFLLLTHTSCILLQGCVCGAAWRSSLDLEVLTDVWCIALLYLHRLHIICLVEGDHKPSISSWDMDASGAAPLVGALDHSCATVPTIPRVVVVAGGAAGTIGVSGHIHHGPS